jgi:hypothetical protein
LRNTKSYISNYAAILKTVSIENNSVFYRNETKFFNSKKSLAVVLTLSAMILIFMFSLLLLKTVKSPKKSQSKIYEFKSKELFFILENSLPQIFNFKISVLQRCWIEFINNHRWLKSLVMNDSIDSSFQIIFVNFSYSITLIFFSCVLCWILSENQSICDNIFTENECQNNLKSKFVLGYSKCEWKFYHKNAESQKYGYCSYINIDNGFIYVLFVSLYAGLCTQAVFSLTVYFLNILMAQNSTKQTVYIEDVDLPVKKKIKLSTSVNTVFIDVPEKDISYLDDIGDILKTESIDPTKLKDLDRDVIKRYAIFLKDLNRYRKSLSFAQRNIFDGFFLFVIPSIKIIC